MLEARILPISVLPFLLFTLLNILLLWQRPVSVSESLVWLSLVCLLLDWASSVFIQIPMNLHLSEGKNLVLIQRVVDINYGRIFLESAQLVAGPNLTRGKGGIGTTMTDADWVRAIRHGIRCDGSSLIVMPSEIFIHMTHDDLSALVSYLKQLTPVDREVEKTHLRFLGRMLLTTGELPVLVADKTLDLPIVKNR